jgi:glycosyltransferase involved in cell wall biosynthesis
MGAVTFSLDPRLVEALQSVLPLRVFVETGTFEGDTISTIEGSFDKVISIELSEVQWKDAARRFAPLPHVQILCGNSGDRLRELKGEFQEQEVLYWLDAHWCVATDTAGDQSQCPLLDELAAIGGLNEKSVVLIDDARLFLAPPLAPHEISQWPSLQDIMQALQHLSAHHELMVINDVIAFYPRVARTVMISFAQSYGMDWLLATEVLNNHSLLASALKEKELCLKSQNESLIKLNFSLKEKELVIENQNRTIRAYAAAYGGLSIFKPLARFVRRVIEIFLPRLGNLNQYQPRPITHLKPVELISSERLLRFSIVTPSFEQGVFISHTISSVADQKYSNIEYFVQDGGSKDSTIDTLKNFQHVLTEWESAKDSGQSQAINHGFKKSRGDIMSWLNSDDILLPGALQTVANFFQKHPDVEVVYGNRLLIDEAGMEIGRWVMPGHDSAVLSWVDYIPQETLFWRRSIWERVGGQVDETFQFAMDWDLLLRFRDAGANFAHIPRFLGAFRIHEQQKTSARINQVGHKEMDMIRERLLGRVPTQEEMRKAVKLFLLRHILVDLKYRVIEVFRGGR